MFQNKITYTFQNNSSQDFKEKFKKLNFPKNTKKYLNQKSLCKNVHNHVTQNEYERIMKGCDQLLNEFKEGKSWLNNRKVTDGKGKRDFVESVFTFGLTTGFITDNQAYGISGKKGVCSILFPNTRNFEKSEAELEVENERREALGLTFKTD